MAGSLFGRIHWLRWTALAGLVGLDGARTRTDCTTPPWSGRRPISARLVILTDPSTYKPLPSSPFLLFSLSPFPLHAGALHLSNPSLLFLFARSTYRPVLFYFLLESSKEKSFAFLTFIVHHSLACGRYPPKKDLLCNQDNKACFGYLTEFQQRYCILPFFVFCFV